tara:strand:+ start:83 stop:436 length:354 start_codon:yes stop_codon:yes gene_type:complete
MKTFYKSIEALISSDYTDASTFNDTSNKLLSDMVNDKKISLINGSLIGIKDINKNVIRVEDLFDTRYIEFPENYFGIYIPDKEISKRTMYNWFIQVSIEDLLSSDMIISKYLLISND